MKKKSSCDDILLLDGLGMDWEHTPESPLGKRAYARMKKTDLSPLLGEDEILVKIATDKATFTGRLLNICKGGMAVSIPALLAENRALKVSFILGREKIISKAIVRQSRKIGEQYITGIMFVGLGKESAEYIAGIYVSKILRQIPK